MIETVGDSADLFWVAERPKRQTDMVGGRVRTARERLGLGVRELARLVGMNDGNLSKLERDEVGPPSGPTFVRLANELRVNARWLADGTGPMDAASIIQPAIPTPAADFVRWYFGGGAIAEAAAKYPDITIGDLLTLHQVMPRHGETDPEVIRSMVQQNRRGPVIGKEVGATDAEQQMRSARTKAKSRKPGA